MTNVEFRSTQHPSLCRVNYLHRGEALDILSSTIDGESNIWTKHDLLAVIAEKCRVSPNLADIVLAYGSEYTNTINIDNFKSDIIQSIIVRDYFQSIACRGFSFEVGNEVEFSWQLRPSIDFSLALYTGKDLYYPSRIRHYLPRVSKSHVSRGRLPAVAFALGRYVQHNLFIFVLQSDLVFQGPACIREHFRGWRKILFGQIQAFAKPGTKCIFLCQSEDVLRTCSAEYKQPNTVPLLWRQIYEGTAAFYGMRRVQFPHRLNIQCLTEIPRRFSSNFYVKQLQPTIMAKGGKNYERSQSRRSVL
ncbi:hypothetical protein DS62_12040 [Smithella sp. SC_K08D17]|nr:hypothetical protein DS62_12040 [Smithella sp. SC_K08D17]